MNVLFASDDNYAPLLTIAMFSFLKSNVDEFSSINVFVLDDGISEKNKDRISKSLSEFDYNLTYIRTKKISEMEFKVSSFERNNIASLTTYSRLFISSLLPDTIDKILYLDCDSLIVDSFKELWDEDLSDYYCGAVLDCGNTAVINRLGFKKDESYYNAGVLLINLKKWREENIEDKFIEFMINNQGRFYQHDQGVINETFKNKIKTIDPKYNLQGYFQFLSYNLSKKFSCMTIDYYSKEILNEAKKHPVFLHFCSADYFRPWHNPNHAYAESYKEYAELSGFEEIIDYDYDFGAKMDMFHKVATNRLGSKLLSLIPTSAVTTLVNKNALREIEEEIEKNNY